MISSNEENVEYIQKAKKLQFRLKRSKLGDFVKEYVVEKKCKDYVQSQFPDKSMIDQVL